MKLRAACVLAVLTLIDASALAVEDFSGSGSFNTTAPTSSDIPNWTTGWGDPSITGWNYVGIVNGGPANGGGSGVYLRNGWVITAGHLGNIQTFSLNGTNYPVIANSTVGLTDSNGIPDVTLFEIAWRPSLPDLPVATRAPAPLSAFHNGSQVAMIGYGGGVGETWGLNTVTANDILVQVNNYFTTMDFETAFGTTTAGTRSATNYYTLVVGDSGGGDFINNSTSSRWELAGLNEAIDTDKDSYLIELSYYASQINTITSTPAPVPILPCAQIATIAALALTAVAGIRRRAG